MSKKETAEKILKRQPLRNSYRISMLSDEGVEVLLDDLDTPSSVVLYSSTTVSMNGNTRPLVKLLKRVPEGEYRFHSVGPEGFEASQEVVKEIDDHPTWMLKRPRSFFDIPEHETIQLKEEDAEVINRFWNLSGGDSTDYIEERIRVGPARGIRRDGELVAWCLTHYVTDRAMSLGFLHVKDGWRRKGFARSVTESMCQYAERKGIVPLVDIFQDNKPSLNLAEDLNFERIGENHWYGGEIEHISR